MTPGSPAEVVAAYQLVRDLFRPSPRAYWLELTLTGSASWATILTACLAESPWLVATALVLAVLLWYRSLAMIHELTHQHTEALPGFRLAWNLVVGVAWFLPSILYEGVHTGHHKKTTYGTAADPEYLPLQGRRGAVFRYLAFSFLLLPMLALRFLVGAPLSWLVPPLRRYLIRSASSYVINFAYERTMSVLERRRLFLWECVIQLAWWPPLALTFAGVLSWRWIVVWYGVFTLVALVNRTRMLAAHRFASDGQATDHLGQFADSIDTPDGWWAELWAPVGMRYHALHHLFPTLPFHNLGRAYRRLTASLAEDSFYHRARGKGLCWALMRLLRVRRHV